jgi:hypothetical protein
VTDVVRTAAGFAAATSTAADPSLGTVRAHVVATCWAGSMTLARLRHGEPDPTPEELQALADQIPISSGVKPKVRIIELAFYRPPVVTPYGDAA